MENILHTAWSCGSPRSIKALSSLAGHLSVEIFAKMHSEEGACAPDVSWFKHGEKNQTTMWLPEGIMRNLLELSTHVHRSHDDPGSTRMGFSELVLKRGF